MTDITLTQAQIDKVLEEHCISTEPPVEPPIDPPPIDPPPIDPDPPVDPGNLQNTTFKAWWNKHLAPSGFYSNTMKPIYSADGVSIAILLPESDGFDFKITFVENTNTGAPVEGVLSWRRDFSAPFIDSLLTGTSMDLNVTPDMAGKYVYANYRCKTSVPVPWYLKLQAVSK